MSHRRIIIEQAIAPSQDAQVAHVDHGSMTATITYVPADTDTDKQIGDRIEHVLKRLSRLADD